MLEHSTPAPIFTLPPLWNHMSREIVWAGSLGLKLTSVTALHVFKMIRKMICVVTSTFIYSRFKSRLELLWNIMSWLSTIVASFVGGSNLGKRIINVRDYTMNRTPDDTPCSHEILIIHIVAVKQRVQQNTLRAEGHKQVHLFIC